MIDAKELGLKTSHKNPKTFFFSQVSCIVSSGILGSTSVFLKTTVGIHVCVYTYI